MQASRSVRLGLSFAGLATAIVTWQLAISLGLGHPLYLPAPLDTAKAAAALIAERLYWLDLGTTLRRAAIGMILAAVVGIPTGLVLGVSPRAYYFVSGPVDFARSIPTAALLPLFIVFFGLGDPSKIAVVFFGCFFIFLIGALYGARGGPESAARKSAIRSMGGSSLHELRFVVVPESLLGVATSLRLAASLALVLAVFTEMFLGAEDGIGRRLIDAYLSFSIPAMYVFIVTLGGVGVVANKLLEFVEARFVALRR